MPTLFPRAFSVLAFCALALAQVAAAQNYPKLKPGLWEMTRTTDHPPGAPGAAAPRSTTTTLCLDESVQKEMLDMGTGAMKGMCSKHDFRFAGGRGTGDFVCDMGGSTMHSKSTMVMNGDSSYRTEVQSTFEPPFMNMRESHSVLIAHRSGACRPGQRPGDMTMNGRTFNIRDALKDNGSK
jgi:hypothetical protein